LVKAIKEPSETCTVAIVGKYTDNGDAYKSIAEALIHAGIPNNCRVNLKWVDSDSVAESDSVESHLRDVHALIIAPGFGARGLEGKIEAVKFARTTGLPFLGICLGMQVAVIEFARNVCDLEGANSEEVSDANPGQRPPVHPVIHLLPEQRKIIDKGATMRLGSYPCNIVTGSLAHRLYESSRVVERHRHRYELNNDYREVLESAGMKISGVSPDYRLVEMVEIPSHPFFIATQAHPEFKSRPNRPHPLFRGLLSAALEFKQKSQKERQIGT
jgi:CTP synthase